jgi:hypothetical protein
VRADEPGSADDGDGRACEFGHQGQLRAAVRLRSANQVFAPPLF